MYKTAVIGAGSWGTALAVLLNKNGHCVRLLAHSADKARIIDAERENKEYLPGVILAESLDVSAKPEQVLEGADAVVCAVPSKYVRETVKRLAPYIPKGALIVNVAKGLEENSLLRLSEVISQELPKNPVSVLSGPSHAEEVGRELPTACVAAACDETHARLVQDMFMNRYFRVYTNSDLVGIEIGAALKNIIALAAGISDGMGYGDNTKAALMTRGIAEIARLGAAMGGDAMTLSGLAGVGDLIVTCTSMHSRNRRAGILLGQGKSLEDALSEVHMVVEGVNTARAAFALSEKFGVEMPIVREINAALFGGKPPRQAVADLMGRDKREE